MKDLLDKVSSYNLFNHLLPGTLFAIIADRISNHHFVQSDVVVSLFLYYFIGLVVSRVGSLLLEPTLRRTTFVRFAEYKEFARASQIDEHLKILLETGNTYRTLCSLFVVLGGLKLFDVVVNWGGLSTRTTWSFALVSLFLLFAFAYRKHSSYIAQRVAMLTPVHHQQESR